MYREDKKRTRQWPAGFFYTLVNKLPIQALSLQLVTPKHTYKHYIYSIIHLEDKLFQKKIVCLPSLLPLLLYFSIVTIQHCTGSMYQTAKTPAQAVLSSLQLVSMFRIPNRQIGQSQKKLIYKRQSENRVLSCICRCSNQIFDYVSSLFKGMIKSG